MSRFDLTKLAEDAPFLWLLRERAVRSPHYRLAQLADLDHRLQAALRGLREAGPAGLAALRDQWRHRDAGEHFAALVLAIESGNRLLLDDAKRGRAPFLGRPIAAALGWLDLDVARPFANAFLAGNEPLWRQAGLTGMFLHRHDPGEHVDQALVSHDAALRARALRGIGELGDGTRAEIVRTFLSEASYDCRFWAAWTCSLLAPDRAALDSLATFAIGDITHAPRAADLLMRRLPVDEAHAWLTARIAATGPSRGLCHAMGALGDPSFVDRLIAWMPRQTLARAAAEAFEQITGVSLFLNNLDRPRPEDFHSGPSDEPSSNHTALDADLHLPWPDAERVAAWWNENRDRFQASQRHLCGQALSIASIRRTLETGRQRERIAAALELKVREPDRPLYETRAPAWRQIGELENW